MYRITQGGRVTALQMKSLPIDPKEYFWAGLVGQVMIQGAGELLEFTPFDAGNKMYASGIRDVGDGDDVHR
jgi:hypothetical protein